MESILNFKDIFNILIMKNKKKFEWLGKPMSEKSFCVRFGLIKG